MQGGGSYSSTSCLGMQGSSSATHTPGRARVGFLQAGPLCAGAGLLPVQWTPGREAATTAEVWASRCRGSGGSIITIDVYTQWSSEDLHNQGT